LGWKDETLIAEELSISYRRTKFALIFGISLSPLLELSNYCIIKTIVLKYNDRTNIINRNGRGGHIEKVI
jgi:hypothetical protein